MVLKRMDLGSPSRQDNGGETRPDERKLTDKFDSLWSGGVAARTTGSCTSEVRDAARSRDDWVYVLPSPSELAEVGGQEVYNRTIPEILSLRTSH
jgi:hypothetical protein